MGDGTNKWSDADLDTVLPEFQTWRTADFVTCRISDAFAVSNWRIGASWISIELSWRLALVAVVIGNLMTALTVTYNGLIGARLHILFTIQARPTYCFKFVYVVIVFRVIISSQLIFAIWPRFRNVPAQLPEPANITTSFMISYFIYWLVILPFHAILAHQVRWFCTIRPSSLPLPVSPLSCCFPAGKCTFRSSIGWAFMNGIYAVVGNFATLGKQISPYVQLIIIPVAFIAMMPFSIIGANGSQILYGYLLWDYSFLCALAFLIASMGVNFSANGQRIICVILGAWAMMPWNILVSAESLNFMDGYTIWLAPIASILISDYCFVHKEVVSVEEMYLEHGIYSYNKYDTNWRAVVAFIVGFAPLLGAFAQGVKLGLRLAWAYRGSCIWDISGSLVLVVDCMCC
ncbi:permease for cytosine/purines, uracil, thiamine, allantoin-domain-containing protein [Calycina marina]|uniref:Permease for cytosine/purines, uracil, thiamine, allantoin-domain-containing protein n=1 Tax=Calycina marina TaxID=1763456 RepID=A0A9P7YZY2_9HELO|nr:permease for cytosine/purines, uracil, thiamine, allantoin-domain-containing protein [Calycina marina]